MELVFYLTNNCNLKCKYCYEGEKNNRVIDFNIIKKLMTKECESKDSVSKISFFGGEPLLQKQMIYDAVNLGKELTSKTKHKFLYSLTTNATLMDDEFISFCKNNKIAVGISIDGNEAVHNLNRRTMSDLGSFQNVLENAKKCIKKKVNIMALPVVCVNNVKFLSESVRYLVNVGFKLIALNFDYSDNWDDETIEVFKTEINKISEMYYNEYKSKNYIKIYPLDTKMYYAIHKNEKCTGSCNGNRIAVDSDGLYYPCVQFVGDKRFIIGDYENGLNMQKRKEFVLRRLSSQTVCEKCAFKRRCLSDCGCARLSTTNDIVEITPVICETERIYINEGDKLANKLFKDFKGRFIINNYL